MKNMICAPEDRFSAQKSLDHKWMTSKYHLAEVDEVTAA